LFTSAPLLLLALYPPVWLRSRSRLLGSREMWCIGVFTLLFFLFSAANQYGRLQFNSGVRYMVPVSPFLFLPTAAVLLRMRLLPAVLVAFLGVYWSWCLSMYRDVEQGLGVLEPLRHVTLEGFRLPWLTTLQNMGYLQGQASPVPLLALAGVVIWALWNVDAWSENSDRGVRL
jgi:hypothetical protein